MLISLSVCKRKLESFDEVAAADSLNEMQNFDIENKMDDKILDNTDNIKDDFEKRNGYLIDRNIFMNAYEDVQNNTGDKDKQIAYDILQKYN